MKYETPEVTALTTAINAIQTLGKPSRTLFDGKVLNEPLSAYEDWED